MRRPMSCDFYSVRSCCPSYVCTVVTALGSSELPMGAGSTYLGTVRSVAKIASVVPLHLPRVRQRDRYPFSVKLDARVAVDG